MKLAFLVVLATLVFATSVLAAPKPCDELKTEIEGKIKANGVDKFTLEVVAADGAKAEKKDAGGAKDGKVVGTCEGGTKQIVYKR